MEIISKKDAKEQGLKRFFTGKACKNGHLSERYVNDSKCVECISERSKKYREENADKVKAGKKRYHQNNRDEILRKKKVYYENNKQDILASQRKYVEKNKEKVLKYQKQYRLDNKDYLNLQDKVYREKNKESVSQVKRDWYQNNLEYCREKNRGYREAIYQEGGERLAQWRLSKRIEASIRRAKKLERTPEFSSDYYAELNDFCIEEIYQQASEIEKLTGEDYHVDHIIPLNGDEVSGLHVWHNLQILEGRENESKSNKFESYMEVY